MESILLALLLAAVANAQVNQISDGQIQAPAAAPFVGSLPVDQIPNHGCGCDSGTVLSKALESQVRVDNRFSAAGLNSEPEAILSQTPDRETQGRAEIPSLNFNQASDTLLSQIPDSQYQVSEGNRALNSGQSTDSVVSQVSDGQIQAPGKIPNSSVSVGEQGCNTYSGADCASCKPDSISDVLAGDNIAPASDTGSCPAGYPGLSDTLNVTPGPNVPGAGVGAAGQLTPSGAAGSSGPSGEHGRTVGQIGGYSSTAGVTVAVDDDGDAVVLSTGGPDVPAVFEGAAGKRSDGGWGAMFLAVMAGLVAIVMM
jgi:hypothetical protein